MDKIRVAVVGVGYLGRFHAQKYAQLPGCRLVGVVDQDAAVAERVAAELSTRAYQRFEALLGEVDAVSIVTPTASHAPIALDFLSAGAHVLVEKPMTQTVEEARALIAAAARGRRVLAVGHLERFNPAILAAEPLLSAPRFIECQRLAPFRERGTDVGVVLDLMIHDIDLLQMMVGSPLVALDAIGTPVFSNEVDIANARLRFANGCVANVTASRVSLKTERKLRVFCDDAYLSIDLQQKILTLIRKRDATQAVMSGRQSAPPIEAAAQVHGAPSGFAGPLPVQIEEQSFEPGDALRAEIEAFLAAARGEREVVVSGEDGLRALTTAIAISSRMAQGAAASGSAAAHAAGDAAQAARLDALPPVEQPLPRP